MFERHSGLEEGPLGFHLGRGRVDSHPHAELQQSPFRIGLLELLVQLGLFRKQPGFMDAQHPKPIAAMVVAADKSHRLQHPGELLDRRSIDDLPEPCLGNGGGPDGRLARRPQQVPSAMDVQFVRGGDRWSWTLFAAAAARGITPLDRQPVPCTHDVVALEAAGERLFGVFIPVNECDGTR